MDPTDQTTSNSTTSDSSTSATTTLAETTTATTSITVETTPAAPRLRTVTLSFVGDCTLGTDPSYAPGRRFTDVLDQQGGDFSYFFRNVAPIFEQDDLTIVNLESSLTTATDEMVRKYNYKGDPSYVNILLEGSVEVANLANNHTYDFLEQGHQDTKDTLKSAGVDYYGYSDVLIRDVDGISVGFAGYNIHDLPESDAVHLDSDIHNAMAYLDDMDVDIRVVSFHWSTEREYAYDESMTELAQMVIDLGADLVVGHHPHVLQGIEQYDGVYVAYSLGNFCYGGSHKPADKDSVILQSRFTFSDDELTAREITLIPVSISSIEAYNDFQPTVLEGDEARRVLERINSFSKDYQYPIP
jgi:poly-gamma-glutamate synthesis protein (capsule biosynthesis protein)